MELPKTGHEPVTVEQVEEGTLRIQHKLKLHSPVCFSGDHRDASQHSHSKIEVSPLSEGILGVARDVRGLAGTCSS